jgi:hypothetical protein
MRRSVACKKNNTAHGEEAYPQTATKHHFSISEKCHKKALPLLKPQGFSQWYPVGESNP